MPAKFLVTYQGRPQTEGFSPLADVFGCSYAGETVENITYLVPAPDQNTDEFGGYTRKHPAMLDGTQLIVSNTGKGQVLALPWGSYSNPTDTSRFASIHGNPRHPNGTPCRHLPPMERARSSMPAATLKPTKPPEIFVHLLKRLFSRSGMKPMPPACVEGNHLRSTRAEALVSLINRKDFAQYPGGGNPNCASGGWQRRQATAPAPPGTSAAF
ncbi:MAG: hypothetical protein U0V70_14105 [Terriglobia bacterium]